MRVVVYLRQLYALACLFVKAYMSWDPAYWLFTITRTVVFIALLAIVGD